MSIFNVVVEALKRGGISLASFEASVSRRGRGFSSKFPSKIVARLVCRDWSVPCKVYFCPKLNYFSCQQVLDNIVICAWEIHSLY